jgi:hypothetical protein
MKAPVTEQLAAVKHANGCDYWVTTHERYTDKFLSYLVTDVGVDTAPVISAIGADYGFMASVYRNNGGAEINFSPDGSFAAIWEFWGWLTGRGRPDTLTLFKFDRWTGVFYDDISLGVDTIIHCIAISPDNKKLYLETGRFSDRLYQYDVSAWNYSSIVNSRITILSTNVNYTSDFQNGSDGKIYGSLETNLYLHVMHDPNASGSACNYIPNDLHLGGRSARGELPSFVQSFFEKHAAICGITAIPSTTEIPFIQIFPNPTSEILDIKVNYLNEINMFDIAGRKVFQASAKIEAASEMKMDVSVYARGIYLLEINTKNHRFNHKIILQ